MLNQVDIKKPDVQELLYLLKWMCRYRNWELVMSTTPFLERPDKFESKLSISVMGLIVFRNCFIADTEEKAEEICLRLSIMEIFSYALYKMHDSLEEFFKKQNENKS